MTRLATMSTQMSTDKDSTENTMDDTTDLTGIDKDDAFHVLQNSRRRAVLRYLAEHDEQDRFIMRDLAEEIAAWEHDTTVQQLVSNERQRVYIALYQSHLPKLDDHGLIKYNQNRGIIERTALTPVLEQYVDDELHASGELTVDVDDSTEPDDQGSGISNAVSSLLDR